MNVELLIPGYLVLIAAGIGGGAVCVPLFFMVVRTFSSLRTTRHNYMAHTVRELKRRNNDYAPIEVAEQESGWKYRLVGLFLQKHRRGR